MWGVAGEGGWTVSGGGIFEYTKKSLVCEICYHKDAISPEETAFHLTFPFTSFKIEFNPFNGIQANDSRQTIFNFKATVLTDFRFSERIEQIG